MVSIDFSHRDGYNDDADNDDDDDDDLLFFSSRDMKGDMKEINGDHLKPTILFK